MNRKCIFQGCENPAEEDFVIDFKIDFSTEVFRKNICAKHHDMLSVKNYESYSIILTPEEGIVGIDPVGKL